MRFKPTVETVGYFQYLFFETQIAFPQMRDRDGYVQGISAFQDFVFISCILFHFIGLCPMLMYITLSELEVTRLTPHLVVYYFRLLRGVLTVERCIFIAKPIEGKILCFAAPTLIQ